jgi:RNA polymerase sigma-70 factor (ECF subfamily)
MDLPEGSSEDRELALAFKRGEKGAYQAIYERYSPRVQGVCRRMLSHPEDAQEASQETFLRMYQALDRFNGRYQLGAWVTRIATNVCLDHLRARSRRPIDVAPVEDLIAYMPVDEESDPGRMVIRNADGRRVRKLLAELPPLHRAAIVLRDFEGLSYEEVAISLDITDCQVKALIHRARKNFRRSWSESLLAALVPARLLDRLKTSHMGVKDTTQPATQFADIATTTAHAASSCSAMLHQCGAAVTERFASLAATAVIVTTTVVGGGLASSSPAEKPEPKQTPVVADEVAAKNVIKRHRVVAEEADRPTAPTPVEPTVAPEQPAEEEPPVTEPEPEPEPTPEPTSTPTAPPAEPEGFEMQFGLDFKPESVCQPCLKSTRLIQETGRGDESGLAAYSQTSEGTATVSGSPSYGLNLKHGSVDGSSHEMTFFLSTSQGKYSYEGRGARVSFARNVWGGWNYTFAGTYRITGRPTYSEAVPESGNYSVTVVFSWKQARIVSSSFSLSEAN